MAWWGWIILGLVLALLELTVPGYIFLGFAGGALLTGLLVLAGLGGGIGLPGMLVVFALLSALCWAGMRRVFGTRARDVKIIRGDINEP